MGQRSATELIVTRQELKKMLLQAKEEKAGWK